MKTKTANVIGTPKWGRIRETYVTPKCKEALLKLRQDSEHVLPVGLVFGYEDGTVRLEKWWGGSFKKAMAKSDLDIKERNLRPHSFRHTCATLLTEAQQDPRRIRAALGWAGSEVAEGYIHAEALSLDSLRDVAEGFSGN